MKHTNNTLLYLNSRQVKEICVELNTIEIIREVFALYAAKKAILPNEAYLTWVNTNEESARSLNMPSFIGGKYQTAGTKIINANIANTKKGLPRASGLTLLFDPLTAQVACIMEGAYISSLRTASVSMLAIDILRKKNLVADVSVIGLGIQGRAHLEYLLSHVTGVGKIHIYDNDAVMLEKTAERFRKSKKIYVSKTAREAVSNSDIIITATTTTKGYIAFDWLRKGALVIHVSLDDLLPEVVEKADVLIVDDWNLVKTDNKRLFGRMYGKEQLRGPDDRKGSIPYVHAEFADIITSKKVGRKNNDQIIIFNPFGLAFEDIGIAHHVYRIALKEKIGTYLLK